MIIILSIALGFAAVVLSLFALMYCLQSILAILPSSSKVAPEKLDAVPKDVAVVIPAHNEAASLGSILSIVREQLRAGDRLIVVADNCSDDTAAVARSFGATVVERTHVTKRGKSYALDYGVRHLEGAPPAMVVFFDADSTIEKDTLIVLAEACHRLGRPVQAKHVMVPLDGARVDSRVACFGHLVKNHVRLLGLQRLGLPCHLTGSGMAFPWPVIRDAELAHGHIAEDKKLGLDLTKAGHPPYYCAKAAVWSDAPYSAKGTKTQRERWEKGHLSLVRLAPQFMAAALRNRDAGLFLLAFDIAVPPMLLLIFMLAATAAVASVIALLGGAALPVWIVLTTLSLVMISTLSSWWVFGRETLPARSLPLIFPFILSKLAIYAGGSIKRSDPQWIRTDRTKPGD